MAPVTPTRTVVLRAGTVTRTGALADSGTASYAHQRKATNKLGPKDACGWLCHTAGQCAKLLAGWLLSGPEEDSAGLPRKDQGAQ